MVYHGMILYFLFFIKEDRILEALNYEKMIYFYSLF